MPYWPYGWPKTLVCTTERSTEAGENWVYVHQNHGYLLAISEASLQLWSAGQHKLRLCCHTRTDQGLQAEGHNLAAFWNGSKGLVAVLTSKGFLHIYSIYISKDPLLPGVSAARDLCKADIYLRHTVKLEQEPTCITGDSKVLLIGFADGTLATAAWSGKIRDVVYPLPAGDWHELQAGLQQQHSVPYPFSIQHCEKSRAVVMVLSDGSCALLGVPSAGLSFLHDLAFSHWVCSPSSGATCASIGASAQMVAVGCSNGQLELYRLQPSAANSPYQEDMLPVADTPVRVLSLESWGHRRYETGGISKVQWSPDSRAIAVGYQTQGLVVWSPSGCRLLCTLRQVPNTYGRDSARRTNSGGAVGAAGGGGMGHSTSLGTVGGGEEGTGSALPSPRGGPAAHRRFSREQVPHQPALLEAGVAALAWGLMGYTLLVAHTGCGWQLVELQFAHSLPNHHRVAHAGVGTQGLTAGAHQPQLHRQAGEEELHVLQAHDRLLIVAEAIQASSSMGAGSGHPHHESRTVTAHEGPDARTHLGSDLLTSHVVLPQQYIASNWPVVHVAVSSSGIDMAVAGQRGLALYSRLTDRWRLFGDVSQERRISCRMLCWMDSIVIVCSGPPVPGTLSGEVGAFHTATTTSFAPSGYELLLFPRYHLDFSSLLCRIPLSQPPLAVDCVGQHILVASEPLEIALFKVQIKGQLSPLGQPTASLQLVREISMLDVGRPLQDIALVPAASQSTQQQEQEQSPQQSSGALATPKHAHPTAAASEGEDNAPAPTQCMLLRWGGLMSVLDLERGTELMLSIDVEAFWLSDRLPCAAPGNESGLSATQDVEMPWWAYGPTGMQLWFPSLLGTSAGLRPVGSDSKSAPSRLRGLAGLVTTDSEQPGMQNDMELEFDQEVYPIGISLADAAIVGVTLRLARGLGLGFAGGMSTGSSNLLQPFAAPPPPSFHPVPESQPVLPCLLRRLLQRGALAEAHALAKRHESGPHFSRSLEWLLFTALENQPSSKKKEASALLSAAAHLVRQFPSLFSECVLAVARKTDAQLWPALFSAVGPPSVLMEDLLEMGALASAACFLLVIDRVEGADIAHAHGLRLVRLALKRAHYPLVAELLRFIVYPVDLDHADDEAPHAEAPPPLLSLLGMAAPSPSKPPPARRSGDRPNASAGAWGAKATPTTTTTRPSPSNTEQAANPSLQGEGVHGQPGQHAARDRFEAGSSAQGQQGPGTSVPQRDAPGGGKGAGGSGGSSGVSWLGWLLGYGSNGGNGSGVKEGQLTDVAGDSRNSKGGGGRGDAGHIGSSVSDTGRQIQNEAGTAAQGNGGPAAPSGVEEGGSGRSKRGSATGTSSLAAKASVGPAADAWQMVAAEAWALLWSGRLRSLVALADGLAFMPEGLPGLMRAHRPYPSGAPSTGTGEVTSLELLSILRMVAHEYPLWHCPSLELEARTALEVAQAVNTVAWVVPLAVMLASHAEVQSFIGSRPQVWRDFVGLVKGDDSLSWLHEDVELMSRIGQ